MIRFFLIISLISFSWTCSAQRRAKRNKNAFEIGIGFDFFRQNPKNTFADSLKYSNFKFQCGGRGLKYGSGLFIKLKSTDQDKSPLGKQRFRQLNSGFYFSYQKAITKNWFFYSQLDIGSIFYQNSDIFGRHRSGFFSGVEVDLLPGFIFHFSKKTHVKLLSKGLIFVYRLEKNKDITVSSLQLNNLLVLSQIELIFKFRGKRR